MLESVTGSVCVITPATSGGADGFSAELPELSQPVAKVAMINNGNIFWRIYISPMMDFI
ncbi:hypothetical protein [Pluralibacter gergoviae]|uniref:Uncharacterized protein n=2 Tax=Pluralibacter gergoviae TaxID=61647 RepID=A0AAW8HVW5_PLUGE|nr:hypothetical protein [Pluralibacter gergoviae]MCK1065718.1 hypothetical protein [Pluralibacter gergoviae]MCV7759335.1 hypothetical protein [Pluralibacter gergoviae]MDQ2312563.1 hypothetical protein [Pluralibacter gergoviae]MDU4435627.1 hypothetical protein [Pluralibacter gergoviae]